MEFERALYRIYERTIRYEGLDICTRVSSYVGGFLGLALLLVLIACHIEYVDEGSHLAEAISEQLLDGYTKYESPEFNLSLHISGEEGTFNGSKLLREDIYGIRVVSESNWLCSFNQTYEFSTVPHVLLLPKDVWDRKSFTRHNVTISARRLLPFLFCPAVQLLNELDTVIVNQLATVFHAHEGLVRNMETDELWAWRKHEIADFQDQRFNVLWAALKFCKAVFLFFIVSSISALICRLAIIGSAGLIMAIDVCLRSFSSLGTPRMMLYYSFPWIGQPAYTLQQSGRSPTPVISAFVYMLLTLYFMYACCYLMWTPMIFDHIFPKGIDDNFYTLVSFLEFFNLIYVRTRQSVVFFPKVIGTLFLVFFMYRFNHFYGFLSTSFLVICSFAVAAMALTLRHYEKAASDMLLPNSEDALSPDNVRQVYQAVFYRTTGSELPELWSLFYPVSSRDQFTDEEMQRAR